MNAELEHVRGVWERTKNDSPIYRLLLSDVDIISASIDIHVSYLSTATIGDTLDISAVADRVGKSMAFTTVKISRVVDNEVGPLVSKGSHTKFLPVSKENRESNKS
ncbi:unnamed protein product [Penicillium glandicola]